MKNKDFFKRISRRIAKILWETGAFVVAGKEPFILSSGAQSNFYINCRLLITYHNIRETINNIAYQIYKRLNLNVQYIAGGATAGIPFSFLLSHKLKLPYVYIRKEKKGYGLKSSIEGFLKKGSSVLLYEDLITDGKSKVYFIDAIRDANCKIKNCLVIFDRMRGGREVLKDIGVELISMCNILDLIEFGLSNNFLKEEQYNKIKSEL